MDFANEFPISHYQAGDFMTNNKLKIHKEADLKNLANIQSSGRVLL